MKRKIIFLLIIILVFFGFISSSNAVENSTLVSGPDFRADVIQFCTDNNITDLPYIVFGKYSDYFDKVDNGWNSSSNVSVSEDNHTKLFKGTYKGEDAIYVLTDKGVIQFNEESQYMFGLYHHGANPDVDGSIFTTVKEIVFNDIDTSNVINMTEVFGHEEALERLDLSMFDTRNVTNMHAMFFDCKSLTKLDLSNFDTSKVTDMYYMFHNCKNLTELDVSSFNTSKVTLMGHMFTGCSSLTSLDISSFDTSNVSDMEGMFGSCNNLKTIYVSTFDNSRYISELNNNTHISSRMFSNNTSLVGGKGTAYDSSHTDASYARLDNAPSEPGYFTYKAKPSPIDPTPVCTDTVKGDWNDDGKFTDSDAVYYIKYIAVAQRIVDLYETFDECKKKALNWVGDIPIENQDVIQVIKYLAHLK